jgi:hypothetical protein
MSQRRKQVLIDLQRLFKGDPGAFYDADVCVLLEQLRDKVTLVQDQRREDQAIYEVWGALSEQVQTIAWSRQRVANMILHVEEAQGLSRNAAIGMISQLAGMTYKAFRATDEWLLKDDWLALRFLQLGENFVSIRAMQIWAKQEDDDRKFGWKHRFEPLHLIRQELKNVG